MRSISKAMLAAGALGIVLAASASAQSPTTAPRGNVLAPGQSGTAPGLRPAGPPGRTGLTPGQTGAPPPGQAVVNPGRTKAATKRTTKKKR
jgi:hypothetical protein